MDFISLEMFGFYAMICASIISTSSIFDTLFTLVYQRQLHCWAAELSALHVGQRCCQPTTFLIHWEQRKRMRSTQLLSSGRKKKEFLVGAAHMSPNQWFECVAVKFQLYYLLGPIHQLPFFYATNLQIGSWHARKKKGTYTENWFTLQFCLLDLWLKHGKK